jgi:immunoglobulin-binding protein 1
MPSSRSQREELRKKVFNPTNLPTMTVEEWAELQMENGLLPSPGSQPPQQEKKKKELTAEEEEAKRLKDSRFDDWKDENPKGDGNKNDHYFKR